MLVNTSRDLYNDLRGRLMYMRVNSAGQLITSLQETTARIPAGWGLFSSISWIARHIQDQTDGYMKGNLC